MKTIIITQVARVEFDIAGWIIEKLNEAEADHFEFCDNEDGDGTACGVYHGQINTILSLAHAIGFELTTVKGCKYDVWLPKSEEDPCDH